MNMGLFLIACSKLLTGVTGHLRMLCNTYISDAVESSKRSQAYGMLGVAFGLGFFVGPTLGAFLSNYYRSLPFAFSFASQIIALLICRIWVKDIPHVTGSEHLLTISDLNPLNALKSLTSTRYTFLLAAAMFVWEAATTGHHSIWVHYTSHRYQWDNFQIGLYMTVMGAATVFVQGVMVHYLVKEFGDTGCIYMGITCNVLAHIVIAYAQNTNVIFMCILPLSLSQVAPLSLRSQLSQDKSKQGTLHGSLSSLQRMSKVVGPLFTTTLFMRSIKSPTSHPGSPFLACAVIYLMVAPIVRYAINHHK
ncbi:hypothetical protein AKO1_007305 [Acrasis kona]|uniref:Uncharacterized protein n=1 Tax=Acrasis kona TaxID=1008807 RepID=A0AAW2YRI5_9EUKA